MHLLRKGKKEMLMKKGNKIHSQELQDVFRF
jgi:hypothetical protein